ncbi:DUF87 domain-containing protein [Emcibacteraceae bacterium]|nr:DUF87 domain-containing protein [Emcibacteraceae bacterium]
MDNAVAENHEIDMTLAEKLELNRLKSVGFITEISGSGAKALCDVRVLRDMSSVDSDYADFAPGQIGTILKVKVTKGFLFMTVRDIVTNYPNGEPTNKVAMSLDFLGHGIRAPLKESGMIFDRGVTDFPIPGEELYPVTLNEVEAIFSDSDNNHFHLGHVFPQHVALASINIDALLGKHFAVLGSTGTGKSCTVALLIRRIVERLPNAHIIMLDPHNEYETAFSDCAVHFDIKNLRLPYWMMNFEEHIEMFIGTYASKNRVVEIDILRRALYAGRVDNAENLSPEQITVDTPIPYKLSFLTSFLEEEMGKLDNPETLTPF